MKKITLMLACFIAIGIASAQKPKVNSAFSYLRKGNLEKAKINIDEASEHEDTKNEASTWFYKGNIYLAIAVNSDPEINALDPDALTKAYEYYMKATSINPEVENDMLNISNPAAGIKIIAVEWARKGEAYFYKNDFYNAFLCYDKSNSYYADNSFQYMASICGYNYEQSRNPKKDTISLATQTKEHLKSLTKGGTYKNENIYSLLANIYMNEKDTVKALAISKKAESIFPDSITTLLARCNVLYWANKGEEATPILEKIKSKAPNDAKVYTQIGSMLEKTNFTEAEKSYNKAIELDPKNFIATFNLGALYFNKFADLKKIASNLKDDAEYNKQMEEANKFLALARPIVEKCYAMDPKDKSTVLMLKQIYANSKELEKAKEMDAILKSL